LWAFEWFWEWIAYALSNWTFLEVLDYLGSFGVLIAIVFYFSESGDRIKQKHYQAWQVINTAQGKGGSGGRVEALQELNTDGVQLVGVDVSGAFLQGVHLEHARLLRSNFSTADARNADLSFADLSNADLHSTNFRQGSLRGADLHDANLDDADLGDADLSEADLSGATIANADLRNATLTGVRWKDIRNLKNANIYGVKNAPEGFISWAIQHGAVRIESDAQWPSNP
jgi:hypothetical protein